MTLRERLGEIPEIGGVVYGTPHETADGSTIITATSAGGWFGPRPLGVFVIHGGKVKFEPAVDATRIATLGVLTGLLAATFATLAVLRRPPWPDLKITQQL
ncbi:hypothetical protein AB0N05_29255 [Nocardia sp. NPDC051030]|uniref:hypothetical protein n=1 Tax=Nocardia sp. NPDC051030 TaxID=3155162 RepID=UPI003434BC9A